MISRSVPWFNPPSRQMILSGLTEVMTQSVMSKAKEVIDLLQPAYPMTISVTTFHDESFALSCDNQPFTSVVLLRNLSLLSNLLSLLRELKTDTKKNQTVKCF